MKLNTMLYALACSLLLGCDDFRQDVKPTYDLEVLALPGVPSILTPAMVVAGLDSFDIATLAIKGSAEVLDKRFVRYNPDSQFNTGSDAFSLDVIDENGTKKTVNVLMKMRNVEDCHSGGVFDFIEVKQGESIEIDLLANDVFCGGPPNINSGGVSSAILSSPSPTAGETLSINLNVGTETVNITFTAPTDVTGKIEFVYEVGINTSAANGPLSDKNGLIPSAFETYLVAQATIMIIE